MEDLQDDSAQDQGAADLCALEEGVQLAGARTASTGKERRKKRRLRNEPQSNVGVFLVSFSHCFSL